MELCPRKLDLFRIAFISRKKPIENVWEDETHSKKHLKGVWMDLVIVRNRPIRFLDYQLTLVMVLQATLHAHVTTTWRAAPRCSV